MRRITFFKSWRLLALLLAAPLALGCDLVVVDDFSIDMELPSSPNAGMPMPAIEAYGWLNGSAPSEGDLAGKVVVLDCFATW